MRLEPLLLLVSTLASACAVSSGPPVALFRSPTLDYPPPAAETADGRVIGVDGMRPEDKLRTSPGVGLGGLTPAASPASFDRRPRWPSPELHERVIDPICGVLGVRAAVWRRRCREQMIEQSL